MQNNLGVSIKTCNTTKLVPNNIHMQEKIEEQQVTWQERYGWTSEGGQDLHKDHLSPELLLHWTTAGEGEPQDILTGKTAPVRNCPILSCGRGRSSLEKLFCIIMCLEDRELWQTQGSLIRISSPTSFHFRLELGETRLKVIKFARGKKLL